MKASIIIPTKNPGEIFKNVLRTVLLQKTEFEYDVLVIDSGSTDGTCDFINKLMHPKIKLHTIEPESFGHGKTRNLGISMTTGEYAVLITHDATPASTEWLSELVSVAETNKNIAGVFGRHVAYMNADPFTKNELDAHFSTFDSYSLMSLDDQDRYEVDTGYRQLLHFFSDNNALVRRSIWEKIPYPDVDFAEDQLWAKQIIEHGYIKAYAKNATVFHSHCYTLNERLRRSFDESYAFNRLFGYVLCANLYDLFRSWLATTKRDLDYTLNKKLYKSNCKDALLRPLDNLMRITGHYLGGRAEALPNKLRVQLSHDKRLFNGLRKARTSKKK
jgi:rhamnosyltransferase